MDENQMVIETLRKMIREELAPITKALAELEAEFNFMKADFEFIKSDIHDFRPAVENIAATMQGIKADVDEIKSDIGEIKDSEAANRSTLNLIARWSEKADKKFNVHSYEPGTLEKESK